MNKRQPSRRLFSGQDLVNLVTFTLLVIPALVFPVRWWPWICDKIARVHVALRRRPARNLDAALAEVSGRPTSAEIEKAVVAAVYGATLQLLRHYRPGGYHPPLLVDGKEHIEGALQSGTGAILWVFPFTYSDLVTKQSLSESGFRVTHLSAVTHGYSETRFGTTLLNRIRTRIEDRYIKERIVLSDQGSVSALRLLRGRLKGNGIVSVTATFSGLRVFDLPLLHGTLRLANGAPSLAMSTGAALLPGFTIRNERGGFTTRVCAPLVPDSSLPRHAAEEQLARQYVDLLKPFVLAHPELWPGWFGQARWIAPTARDSEKLVSST